MTKQLAISISEFDLFFFLSFFLVVTDGDVVLLNSGGVSLLTCTHDSNRRAVQGMEFLFTGEESVCFSFK